MKLLAAIGENESAGTSANAATSVQEQLNAQEREYLRVLGRRLSAKLKTDGRDVLWLSREARVARSTLHEILAGRSNPRIATLRAISIALGYTSTAAFLGEIEAVDSIEKN